MRAVVWCLLATACTAPRPLAFLEPGWEPTLSWGYSCAGWDVELFDDTIEHEAWNRSDRTRVVLLLDFRPQGNGPGPSGTV